MTTKYLFFNTQMNVLCSSMFIYWMIVSINVYDAKSRCDALMGKPFKKWLKITHFLSKFGGFGKIAENTEVPQLWSSWGLMFSKLDGEISYFCCNFVRICDFFNNRWKITHFPALIGNFRKTAQNTCSSIFFCFKLNIRLTRCIHFSYLLQFCEEFWFF